MTKPLRISYAIMFGLLVLVWSLDLATPLITALFAFLALQAFNIGKTKRTAVGLFTIVFILISYSFIFFVSKAVKSAPVIVDSTIPVLIEHAQRQGLELPFEDASSFKAVMMNLVTSEIGVTGRLIKVLIHEIAFFIMGVVVAISVFMNAKFELDPEQTAVKNNLYSLTVAQVAIRFRGFFKSFATVMGAQIIISAINTIFTAIFLFWVGIPHMTVLIGLTFLCGLLPIVGNIISNAVIVCVALTVSPNIAIAALVYLIVLHKLEYFLNSKIVGDRIKNPMWLTLLGLLIGERLMGVPGMILAPVVLHYIKVEASQQKVAAEDMEPDAEESTPAAATSI